MPMRIDTLQISRMPAGGEYTYDEPTTTQVQRDLATDLRKEAKRKGERVRAIRYGLIMTSFGLSLSAMGFDGDRCVAVTSVAL